MGRLYQGKTNRLNHRNDFNIFLSVRVALAMLWGNFYYVYMARKLAYKEKRDDICAMPYGINTPGACNRI
jgi:hypothetical protein